MSGKTEADRVVTNLVEAAESMEQQRKTFEKNAETTQREKEAAIADIYEVAGKIKSSRFVQTQAEFFNLIMLKKVKESKEYRSRFGMTWEQFCEYVGVDRRRIDEQFADLKPFKVEFLAAFASFSGMPLNKVKYLAEPISAESAEISTDGKTITYKGETIPVDEEHAEDLQTLIADLEESHKKALAEKDAALAAKDKVLGDKETLINKYADDVARLEGRVQKTDLSPEEEEAMETLKDAQLTILDRLFDCRARFCKETAPEIAQNSFYFLLIFLQKISADFRQDLQESYPDAMQAPWEAIDWEMPADHVLVDGLPCSRGIGKKHKEYMDKRNAPKEK